MTLDINNACCNIPLGKSTGAGSGGGGGQVEWVTFPNAVILGEPQINGSQVSGFSTEDYMMFPFILDVHDRPFEVNFSFTTGEDVTTQQNILDSQFGLALAIQNGHGLMAISNNGESWASTATGLLDIMPNTTYYAKLTWNRLQYKTALSVDGKTFIDDMAITNATRPYPRTMYIGGGSVEELGHTTHPFQGIVDMKNASLLVDGNTVWLGMDDPGLATRADVSLSNLDAAGEARFTAKQNKLTAMDGVMIVGNEISANVDGETVIINGSGQLEAVGGASGDFVAVPVIIDSFLDGASGYRVWSKDKTGYNYCEQWGNTTNATTGSVSYIKAYKDANYDLQVTTITRNPYYTEDVGTTKATNGFTWDTYQGTNIHNWKASGYLAEGQYNE